MARHHDVVQVSVNHRLNILGFFDAAEIGGSAYENSANVGMTDLVAALKRREYTESGSAEGTCAPSDEGTGARGE